ncbi:glycosyl hydrolase family 3 N terminal domain-containing protein [Xylariaceae sp. FL0804]|nr:glycosyl hydrolase family 3 N terminal domain-containing protein [Xylariaceae sp. FL0804]
MFPPTKRTWLAALLGGAVHGAAAVEGRITSDTYFYGQSPPVYPSPETQATGSWAESIARAKAFVDQLSLAEKVNFTAGSDTTATGCSGMIPAVERLNFPGICLTDAGNGVRSTDYVTGWPSGIHVGASWNKDLAYQRTLYMGGEAKTKGVNVLLGPVVGPMGRIVQGGRNWEGFSIDPYLAGSLVSPSVKGLQDAGVTACTKHFILYEQETHRIASDTTGIQVYSSNADDKTMHELYLWPFADAVKAGTGSIMCSYNRLNNSEGCQNSKTLNGLLKTELGFQGWVVSDWDAQESGVGSALAGMDVAMPTGGIYWGDNLTLAINNGSVPESRLDDMVTRCVNLESSLMTNDLLTKPRVMASWYQMKQDEADFPEPGVGMPLDLNAPHAVIDARNKSSRPTSWNGALEGQVLVKNAKNALPLDSDKMKLISLFGYSAKAPNQNTPAAAPEGETFAAWPMGAESANLTELNAGFFGDLDIDFSATARNGTLISGGGSGSTPQSLYSAPYDALVAQAFDDGTTLYWDFESAEPSVDPTSDACIVVGNAWATEGYDRPSLRDDFTDGLIESVASQCANTIVVFHNAGTRLVDAFVDHPNVTAVVFAHLPGQDSGRALVALLYGRENFSGRLPYTVARNESDYGVLLRANKTQAGEFQDYPQSEYDEGVFVDYRRFDALGIAPRYPFGFGLSYTTFDYARLSVTTARNARTQAYPRGAVAAGGAEDLWDVLATVRADVTNAGGAAGMEVAQLYLGLPGAGSDESKVPAKQLRGFEKPSLKPGQTATVEFPLTRRDLSVWDAGAQQWLLQSGEYKVYVGRDSRDLPLTGTLSI